MAKIQLLNKKEKIIIDLPETFQDLKEKCKEVYNLTPNQIKSIILKYKENEAGDDYCLEDDTDYTDVMELNDLSNALIIVTYDTLDNPIKEVNQCHSSNAIIVKELEIKDDKNIQESICISKYEGANIDFKRELQELEERLTNKFINSQTDLRQSIDTILRYQQEMKELTESQILNTSMNQSKYQSSKHKIMHMGIQCNECKEIDIRGKRYKCSCCNEYNLCETCFDKTTHEHIFLIIKDSMKISILKQNIQQESMNEIIKTKESIASLSKIDKKQLEEDNITYTNKNITDEGLNIKSKNDISISNEKQFEQSKQTDYQKQNYTNTNSKGKIQQEDSLNNSKGKVNNTNLREVKNEIDSKMKESDMKKEDKNKALNIFDNYHYNPSVDEIIFTSKKQKSVEGKDQWNDSEDLSKRTCSDAKNDVSKKNKELGKDYNKLLKEFDALYATEDHLTEQRRKEILMHCEGDFDKTIGMIEEEILQSS